MLRPPLLVLVAPRERAVRIRLPTRVRAVSPEHRDNQPPLLQRAQSSSSGRRSVRVRKFRVALAEMPNAPSNALTNISSKLGVIPDSSRFLRGLIQRRRCGMSYYRLYFRDYEDHFCGCRQFEAPDEAHAILRADRMCCGLNRELWGESRLLRRWDEGAGDRPFGRPA